MVKVDDAYSYVVESDIHTKRSHINDILRSQVVRNRILEREQRLEKTGNRRLALVQQLLQRGVHSLWQKESAEAVLLVKAFQAQNPYGTRPVPSALMVPTTTLDKRFEGTNTLLSASSIPTFSHPPILHRSSTDVYVTSVVVME